MHTYIHMPTTTLNDANTMCEMHFAFSGCKGDGEAAEVAGEVGDRHSDMSGDEEYRRAQPLAAEKR